MILIQSSLCLIIAEEFGGFLMKSQAINSAYEVNIKHAVTEFVWSALSNGVDAKFGSNAARIFRYFIGGCI